MSYETPQPREGEDLWRYADRLAQWAMEQPADYRFEAVGEALVNMLRSPAQRTLLMEGDTKPATTDIGGSIGVQGDRTADLAEFDN